MKVVEAKVDFKLIGERIKQARKKKGWPKEQLAESIDVGTVYISKVERGNTNINLRKLAQISVALEKPLEELITGTTVERKNHLEKEIEELLANTTKEKQQLIYNIAKIVVGIKFV